MRKCEHCEKPIPPETEHYHRQEDDEHYCIECLEEVPGDPLFFLGGEYLGDSDQISHVESYDDDYEEGAE
ncbi:hypothetical protein [Sporosarcina sp. FA9]|uniref:hypothetical protein n=1 Tax=Sporosarcina sp. FA9 TaxID=3413030 RepID=UPI003F65D588